MEVQALRGHRWFIWTLVFLLIAGVGLVTYIQYSSVTDAASEPAANVVHHAPKSVSQAKNTPVMH